MYFTQLRSFQAVAIEGSFTSAAERLNLSQPTITQQVRQLETMFNVELFHRNGRRIELSEVGKLLLTATEKLFTTSDETVDLLRTASGLGTGHLRISAVGPLDIIPIIGKVAEANPQVRISLSVCNSEDAQKSLMEFRADVAMLASTEVDPRFHYESFGTRRLVLFVSSNHPWSDRGSVKLKDLHKQRMIIREIGSHTRQIFERACAKAGVEPMQRIEINNRDAFREAVASGLGIGVIGDRGIAPDDRIRRLTISDMTIAMDRQLACLKERKDSRLIRSFLEHGKEISGWLNAEDAS